MSDSGFDKVRDMRGDNDIDVGDGGSRITTGNGDDTITAGDGYDKISAGRGDNQISVGDGGSKIATKGGDDTITAGDGYDRISAGNGDNQINVGDGGSFIKTGRGDDLIVSEDGYDFIFAGGGNNEIDAGDGGSFIKSGSGDDTITTGEGYDRIFAGNGDNEITTGDGGSFVVTGRGDDLIETGDGWDFVHAGNGDNQINIGDGGGMVFTGSGDDDVTIGDQGFAFVHTGNGDDRVTVQIDEYLCFAKLLGGNGVDTLVLDIGLETYKDDNFQAEMAYFLEHRAPDGRPFYFRSLNIYVHSFEQVEVVVDGVSLDPIDQDVAATDDAVTLSEDDGRVLFGSVTSNDDVPNGLAQVTLIEGPTAGVLNLAADGTFSFDPNDDFEALAEGEIAEVTFTYQVEDLDGDTSQATATISIIGDNDAPFLAEGTLDADEDGASVDVDLSALGADVDSDDDGSTLTYSVTGQPGEGSASIAGTTLSFDPGSDFQDLALGEARDVTIQVTAEDAHGATAVNTVTVTVTGGNDAPTLAAALATADEDGASVDVDLSALGADVDSDDDGSTLTYSVTGQPGEGSASIAGTTLSFDPGSDFQDLALGEPRDVTIQVTAEDAHGATAVNTVTVTVTGGNDAPTLAAALATADEDGASVDVDLSALGADVDSDDDGSTLTYSVTGQPGEGSASIAGTTLSFDPGSDFQDLALGEPRDVTIQVTAEDAHGATAVNTVTVTVTGGNDAPTLAAALATADEDGASVDVDLSALGADVDSDDDGSTLTYSVTGQPGEGSASIAGTTLSFDPGSDFQDLALGEPRDVTIQVTAEDAHGATAVNTVTVTVTGGNDAPTLAAALATADEDGASVDVDLSALGADVDSDDDGSTLTYSVTGQPGEGSASIAGTTLSFDPGSDFQDLALGETRDVTIQVTAEDAHGATAVNTVTVTVTGGNDAPTLAAALATADEDGASVDVDLSALGADVDSDDDGSTLAYSVTGQPGEGSASIAGTMLSFDPGSDFQDLALGEARDVTIQVTAEDAHGATVVNTVTVTVTGGNDAPTLAVALATADEDGASVDVDLSALGADVDSDDDGSTLAYSVTGQPGEGSASIAGTTLSFDPGSDFQDLAVGETRDVTIQVTAEDATGATAVNTVTVTVTGGNDAPSLAAALATADEDGTSVDVDLSALGADVDSDDDGSTLTYSVSSQPAEGSASISGTTLTFNPGADFQGLAQGETRDVVIQVTAEDAHGATVVNEVTVTVTGVNDAPVTDAEAVTTGEDTAVNIDVLDGDTDAEGQTLSVQSVTDGANGTVSIESNGTVTYTPNANFNGSDSFTYTASDGNGGTTVQTVAVTVDAVNDAPEAAAIDAGTADEDGGVQTINLLAGASDIEGDTLSVSGISVVDDAGVSLSFTDNGDGTISIDPIQYGEDLGQGESRVVTVSYDIGDGTTTTGNTATLTVNGVTDNIAPTAQDTAVTPGGAGYVFDDTPVVTSQQVSETDTYQSGQYQYDANSDNTPTVIAFGDGGYAMAWREQDAEYNGSTRLSQAEQVAVQIYGADDAPLGAKMTFGEIDTSYGSDTGVDRSYEYNPRLVDMADGGFALVWDGNYRSYSGTSQTRYERDIYVQVFDADGSPTSSDPIKLSQTVPSVSGSTTAYDAFQDYQPEIAALADGGIAVSWRGTHNDVNGTSLDTSSSEQNVYVRAFDSDGTARSAEVSLGSVDTSYSSDDRDRHYDSSPSIAASEDGSFAVVWQGSYNNYSGTTYVGNSNDIYMQMFDADGVAQGATIQVSQNVEYQNGTRTQDAHSDYTPEIAALANGGYVVTWQGQHAEYNGSTLISSEDNVWARVYDADGQPVSDEISIGEVDQSYGNDDRDRAYDNSAKVAATVDGGFVVTWHGNYYAYSGTTAIEYTRDIYVQRFDENGDALSAAQQISQTGERTTGNYQVYDSIADSDPQITELLGGGFVVSWYSDQQTYNGSVREETARVVQAQRFGEDGVAIGDVITLGNVAQDQNGYDQSNDSQARITALNDGGFAIAWQNYTNYYDTNGSYQGNSSDVFVAAVHASGGGTELNDPVEVDVAGLIDDADLVDGDQLTVTVATGSNGSTASVTGTVISLLPNATYYAALGKDETEEETFTYTVTDLAGAQTTATITLTVTGNNDKPEANAISGAATENGAATTLAADFTDVDANDTHTYSVNAAETLGVVTDNGDGTFDYDPNGAFEALAEGETATDTFRYTVRDSAGASSTATATVTVTGENDAPTASDAEISNGYVFAEAPETNEQKVSLNDPYINGSQTYDANYGDQQQVIAFGDGGYAVAWRQQDSTYYGTTLVSRDNQIAVQIYDAEHNKIGGIQTFGEVDQSYSRDDIDRSYDYNPQMVEMPDGGFAVTWYGDYRSYSGTTQTRYERDIFVQSFDANGDPISTDPIKVTQTVHAVNGTTTQYDAFQDSNPMIGGLADGGIAITWQSQDYAVSGTTIVSNDRSYQIKVQAFDADGTARGTAVELGSDDRSRTGDNLDRHSDYQPKIATSEDGGFAVVWNGSYSNYSGTTYTGNTSDVFIQLFDADGVAQGTTQQVSQTETYQSGSATNDAYADYAPEITALADGGYAVVWYGQHSEYSGSTQTSAENNVYVRVYDSEGQAKGQEISIGSVDTSYSNDTIDRHYEYSPQVTSTEDGGFVVVWQGAYSYYSGTTQTNYEADIFVQRFDADGTQIGSTEKISQTVPRANGSSDYDGYQDANPEITNLEGGGFVVVWQSNQQTYNGSTFVSSEQLILAQRFDAQGVLAGDVINIGTVAQDTSGNDRSSEANPEVTALEGGGFAITWQNSTSSYSSTGSYLGNEQNVMVAAIQPIGNGSLADGIVVDVADKIDDIDLAGGDSLTVSVDASGSNGSTATVVGTEITISPNLAIYAPLAKGETAEETFTYTVTDESGAQATATLTFTARGENDAPVVDSVTYSTLDSGTIAFSDVDNADTHAVSATDASITGDATALDGIDVFDFIAFDPVDQVGDTVDWAINVPSAAQSAVAAALSDGETLTIDYTIGVADEEEDTALTTVSITLDGDGFLI